MQFTLLFPLLTVGTIVGFIETWDKGPRCPSAYFACPDGDCIRQSWVCDGEDDCDDNSDESNCNASCPTSKFRCGNGRCIPNALVCDAFNHCGDYSDESNCDAKCTSSSFLCNNGRCISNSWKCDGENDCHDDSDELNCAECSNSAFRCGSGKCIPDYWACDGDFDCDDASDESNCGSSTLKDENTKEDTSKIGVTISHSLAIEQTPVASTACFPEYCENGGQCEIVDKIRICRCSDGYTGKRCRSFVEYNRNNSEEGRDIVISVSVVALVFSVISLAIWLFRSKIFRANLSAGTRKFGVYFHQLRYRDDNKVLCDSSVGDYV